MLISVFGFVGWVFCWEIGFDREEGVMKVFSWLTCFLACLAGVFPGNACWCWRLGYWGELEEGSFEEMLCSVGDRVREKRQTSASVLLQRWR